MISGDQLADAFARNLGAIKMQTKGLTHEDSLLQLPFRGNCLNWVLGHILDSRNTVVQALGQEALLSEQQAARYGYGSEPVTCDGPGVLRLEELLALLERSQEAIAAGLQAATPTALDREVQFAGRSMTVGQQVFFLLWHETYHAGQTEILRQLAGVNDKVI